MIQVKLVAVMASVLEKFVVAPDLSLKFCLGGLPLSAHAGSIAGCTHIIAAGSP